MLYLTRYIVSFRNSLYLILACIFFIPTRHNFVWGHESCDMPTAAPSQWIKEHGIEIFRLFVCTVRTFTRLGFFQRKREANKLRNRLTQAIYVLWKLSSEEDRVCTGFDLNFDNGQKFLWSKVSSNTNKAKTNLPAWSKHATLFSFHRSILSLVSCSSSTSTLAYLICRHSSVYITLTDHQIEPWSQWIWLWVLEHKALDSILLLWTIWCASYGLSYRCWFF